MKEAPGAGRRRRLGVAVEGSRRHQGPPALPQFDVFNRQRHYVDVFNKGTNAFSFTASASVPWITLSENKGMVDKDQRVWVSVDWSKAPQGKSAGTVRFSGADTNFTVNVAALNPAEITPSSLNGFVEGEGVVSVEPEHYSKLDAGATGRVD